MKDDRLIIALDVSTPDEALDLVESLKAYVGCFKIGLQLFTAHGPSIVERILEKGSRVFLDLKLHDIPNTVASAALEAARLGVHMMTLHTLGGETMMREASRRLQEASEKEGWTRPKLLGVTLLTSMDARELRSTGIDSDVAREVLALARLAHAAGLDGVVSSPRELSLLRSGGFPEEFLFVTPGIRSPGAERDDQSRSMSAAEATGAGAHYLVVGRPVTRAPDPVEAIKSILGEMTEFPLGPVE